MSREVKAFGNDGSVIEPAKVFKCVRWSVETDFSIMLDTDLPEEEIIKKFLSGEYDLESAVSGASRLTSSITIEDVNNYYSMNKEEGEWPPKPE